MTTFLVGSLVAMVALTGIMLAVTPWLQRKNECFAVTVPEVVQRDPRLMAMKKRYAVITLTVTALCCAALVVVMAFGPDVNSSQGSLVLSVAVTIAVLIPCVQSFALMLAYRKRVQGIKEEEGWTVAGMQESVAVVGEEVPKPISLWWNVLYAPVILLTLGLGIAGYSSMPDMVPTHGDFAGNADAWSPKGPKVVLMPVAIQLFLCVTFLLCHWSVLRSKRPTDPWSPATSALAYGMFARAQSIYLFVSGLALSLVMGVTMQLSFMQAISLMTAAVLIMVVALAMVVGAIAMTAIYGQAGSRVFKKMQDSESLAFDDDKHWILGIFYFDKNDPSLFLPKRFGMGWTINMARPAAWALILGLILLSIAFVVLTEVLAG